MIPMLLAACLLVQDSQEEERDVELDADACVSLSIVTGALKVKGWDKPHAHLKVARRGRDWKDVAVKIESDKKRLDLKAEHPHDWKGGHQAHVVVELSLPAKLKAVVLSCVTGDISFEGVATGETRATTVTGGVVLGAGRGELTATTTTGDLRVSGWTAKRAQLVSTTGDIEASVEAAEIVVSTVTGRLRIDAAPPKAGAWSLKASNVTGSIDVRIPATAGARVRASTFNGRIACPLDLKDSSKEEGFTGHKLSGTLGDGRGTVDLNTLNGRIAIGAMKE